MKNIEEPIWFDQGMFLDAYIKGELITQKQALDVIHVFDKSDILVSWEGGVTRRYITQIFVKGWETCVWVKK